MLYIKKGERTPLPRQYRSINNICAVIYDEIAKIFTSLYEPLKKTNVTIDKHNHILTEEFESKKLHAFDWLAKNNLNAELTTVATKHITLSIVSDFINFMYESLHCARKGKLTVAYALLRKPLTDELLLLEQILVDKEDFVNRFFHKGEPVFYDPSDSKLDKQSIIKNSVERVVPKGLFSDKLIYKFRYDKSYTGGLNGMTNHALHIVTRDKNYRTIDKNLNFVFSVDEDFQGYFAHYYYFVPYLLFYAAAVIDEIVFQFLPREHYEDLKSFKLFKRLSAYLLWISSNNLKNTKRVHRLMHLFRKTLETPCENCGTIKKFTKADYELFLETEFILCKKCFHPVVDTHQTYISIQEFLAKANKHSE